MPSDFDFIAKFGTVGTGNSNLSNPSGFAVSGDFIYIADTGNGRIVKRKVRGGAYVAENSTDLTTPKDIEVVGDRLYVVDNGTDKLHVLDFDLVEKGTISGFNDPVSVVEGDGRIYVSNNGANTISVLDQALSIIQTISVSAGPRQVAYDSNEKAVYVVAASNTKIEKYLVSSGTLLDSIVATDSTGGAWSTSVLGVAVHSHYVYALETARLQVFDTATLTTRASAGSSGSGNAQISSGNYVKVVGDIVMHSDTGNDRIMSWYGHKPSRGFSSGDSFKIGGRLSQNPFMVIGDTVTIGGTASSDLANNVEEEALSDNFANVEET